MVKDVNEIMQTIPEDWRKRWCGGEMGPCACIGCVQVGNRLVMVKEAAGEDYKGDPEYILESKIPKEVYNRLKITKQEWSVWMSRDNQ